MKCEIYGEVKVNSHITGVPELTLSFTNPSILNDVRFHPCVRFRPWESHQILSFVPPDGQFKLMSYRFVDFAVVQFSFLINSYVENYVGEVSSFLIGIFCGKIT